MFKTAVRMLFSAILLALAACATGDGAASPADASGTGGSAKTSSGATLWAQNCVRCHNNRSPANYSDSEWSVAMRHMRVRANLTAEEERAILEFLKSAN